MSGRMLSDYQFPLILGVRRWPSSPAEDTGQKGMVVDPRVAPDPYTDPDMEMLDIPFGIPTQVAFKTWRP